MKIYQEKIQNLKIEVILQDNDSDIKIIENNILICNIVLNLLDRFLTNIRYTSNPEYLKKYFPDSFLQNIQSKNFDSEPTLSIIIGNKREAVQNPLYLSSNGWSIYLSRKKPCSWKIFAKNPLSAIYIAALGVGEVFKLLVEDYVSVEIINDFIYDFITHGKTNQPVTNPLLPSYLDINLILVGCGAIGQAIAFALDQFELRGKITLIDPDIIDESNKQRYLLAFNENIGRSKTQFLSRYLMDNKNNLLTVLEFIQPYEISITIYESLFKMENVFISVDNKRTRVNLQAALPRRIWNIWTDTAQGILRYGIGKHDFANENQCLACAYYPEGDIPNQMELNAAILGISQEEINERLQRNDLITKSDLEHLMNNYTIPPDQITRVKSLEGQPFSNIFHGECGIYNVRLLEKHEPTPATHISVLAGVYSVIQFILTKMGIENGHLVESVAEFNAFAYPNEDCLIKKKRHPKCVCNDPIYQVVYKNKWGL